MAPTCKQIAKCTLSHLTNAVNTALHNEQMLELVHVSILLLIYFVAYISFQDISQKMMNESGNINAVEFVERNANFVPQWGLI